MKQKSKIYEPPQLTVVSFKVERGFTVSQTYEGSIFMMFNSSLGEYNEGSSQLENRTFQNTGWSSDFNI